MDNRHFQRMRPFEIKGFLICWQNTIPVEIENISLGGAKLKHVPIGVIEQVGQLYLNLGPFGEIFTDFRCLQKGGGPVRLQFKNMSYAEQMALMNYIDYHEFPIADLAS